VKSIDLNCDMGESFGPWKMGQDEAVMPHITSANIACGAHAGDPEVMAATVRLAKSHHVSVGAHPGYPDLRFFGRRPMRLSSDEVISLMLYQLGALWAVARSEGAELCHVKPHGALYNSACANRELAVAVCEAVRRFSADIYLVGLPDSELEAAAGAVGQPFLAEGFADRAYEPNGSLRDRNFQGAMRDDPAAAGRQAVELAGGSVTSYDGTPVKTPVRTICIHGDTPGAPEIARAVRRALESAGYTVQPPDAATHR
jgi:UPF0271 protein